MNKIESLLIKSDVTFVKIVENVVILAGVGGHLHIFDAASKKLLKTLHVFEGQKIYGATFTSKQSQCFMYGGNQMKLLSCKPDFVTFKTVKRQACADWILASKWINQDACLATALMHNSVSLWTNDLQLIQNVFCAEKCLLYSAFLVNDTWKSLVVLSGTVFSEVLVWKPNDLAKVISRLEGHKGVIFSLDFDKNSGLICSTSDDRSAKLWSVSHDNSTHFSDSKITLKCSLYGHASRVFKCQILDDYVITTGEDSMVNLWNLDGILLQKMDAHQGAPVWALDYDKNTRTIVTGGGDCALNLFSLEQNLVKDEVIIPEMEVCKRLGILDENDLVVITEQGVLYHFKDATWNKIAHYKDFRSYALLDVSECKSLMALAGYHGLIIIYHKVDGTLKFLCKYQIEDNSRIFSFHWLNSAIFLTCGTEGNMNLWQLNESSQITHLHWLTLPASKERWTTSAVMLSSKILVVGDRRGNVFLYSLANSNPIQAIKKAHYHLGVTSLHFQGNVLTTLGRNSVIKKFTFDATSQTLTPYSTDKVPLTWLIKLHKQGNDEFLLAFMSTNLIMWDYKKRRILLQLDCGGGHRSWDFHFHKGHFAFVYMKDKIVNVFKAKLTSILPTSIIEGFHINEINSAVFLPCPNSEGILISGGEDTTLRVSKLDLSGDLTNLELLKVHLSSIRVVKVCKLFENGLMQRYLLFTGGGRAQIILWELEVVGVNVKCHQSYCERDFDLTEIRVMDLCVVKRDSCIILVSVCSDGTIKFYLVENRKLILVKTVIYKLKCILKVHHILVCGRNVLITMATDGKISFWDFSLFFNNLHETSKVMDNEVPFACVETHQSGINSFSCKSVNETSYIFLTGGDDNAVTLSLFCFQFSGDLEVNLVNRYCDVSSHCAQITGVFMLDGYFLTTSIDQKLNVYSWKLDGDNNIACNFLEKYNSSIPDIQGMECYVTSESVFAFLFGKGVEICKIRDLFNNKEKL